MSKNKINRENIIKIKEDVDRMRSILCSIVSSAEGYKDPLDDLIYSRRELDTIKELKEAKEKIIELKDTNNYLAKIINRDIDKHEKRITKLEKV